MFSHMPRKGLVLALLSFTTLRDQDTEMNSRGYHSTSSGPRRGVSLSGKTVVPTRGMALPLLLNMAPLQNYPGWGPRPQRLPSAWLLEGHLLGWLGRWPLSQTPGPRTALLPFHPATFCSLCRLCFGVKEWMPGCWEALGKGCLAFLCVPQSSSVIQIITQTI